jgi:phytoene/squalene synthetase
MIFLEMERMPEASARLAASITRTASLQTYFTIMLLADRRRAADACRAYAYFRWVDDWLDRADRSKPERLAFLQRQTGLIEHCFRAATPSSVSAEEQILVDLLSRDPNRDGPLARYIDNMLAVMAFDAERRGRLISQAELNSYQRSLAIAIMEALDYFIGGDRRPSFAASRCSAVTAAHITHMLRDTWEDVQLGYFNIPLEYLHAHKLSPLDVSSPAYLAWVRSRVQLARHYFNEGCDYLAHIGSTRYRLAIQAYAARFEIVLDMMECDGFRLRRDYSARKSLTSALRMGWSVLCSAMHTRAVRTRLRSAGFRVDR